MQCTADGSTVTVTVDEGVDDQYTVTLNGETVEVTDSTAVFEDVADGTYDVVIDGDNGETITVDVDCDEPVVNVTSECSTNGGTVTVTVDETPGDEFTATLGELTADVVDGEAVFEGVADGTYTLTVTDSSGATVAEESVTVDCDEPVVEVTQECVDATGTLVVTIDETPDDDFTVAVDGVEVDLVDGAYTVDELLDGEHTITVTDGSDQVVYSDTVTVECQQDQSGVGGEEIEKPEPAPAPAPTPAPPPGRGHQRRAARHGRRLDPAGPARPAPPGLGRELLDRH